MNEIVIKAMAWAMDCHEATNHKYNEYPYSLHLNMVYSYALKYIYLIPDQEQDNVLAACWTHDLIEDARQTYNDVRVVLSERIADLTFALTNEKGKNRSERGSEKYYSDMRQVPFATFIKICDRLANASYSKYSNSSMIKSYQKESRHFNLMIFQPVYAHMFDELHSILT